MPHIFHMPVHGDGIGSRGGHHKVRFTQASRSAVIHGNTVLAQHQTVTGLADGQFQKPVGIHTV